MRRSIALVAAVTLVLAAAPAATAKQGLLRKPAAVAAPLVALPSGAMPAPIPATAMPAVASAGASSPGAPVTAIVIVPPAPGAIDPGVDVKPMPLPSIDLPASVEGSAPLAIHHPWDGAGGFVPGFVGEGAADGAVVVGIVPGATVAEGIPMIGLVASNVAGDGAVALTAATPPAWGPGGKHGHPHHGLPTAAGGQAAVRMAAVDAPAAGARAPAGGWPGRAAGLRGDGINAGPSRGAAAGGAVARHRPDAAGSAAAARGAAAAKGDAARPAAHADAARPAAGMAGAPAGAAAAPPRWRDRLRFAWPMPR